MPKFDNAYYFSKSLEEARFFEWRGVARRGVEGRG